MASGQDKILSISIILLIFIVLAFFIYNLVLNINIFKLKRNPTIIESEIKEKYTLSPLVNDPIKGERNTLVSIYLFTDYELQETEEILNIIDDLMKKYPDDLNLVWKDMPLTKHYFAKGAALAARCALEQDKYWEFSKRFLGHQRDFSSKFYQQIANDLEMDIASFLSCYTSQKYLIDIEYNIQEAYVLDIEDIPTVFINQQRVETDLSFENLDKVISTLIE